MGASAPHAPRGLGAGDSGQVCVSGVARTPARESDGERRRCSGFAVGGGVAQVGGAAAFALFGPWTVMSVANGSVGSTSASM